jgi:XTP/dITP diphosphohydrolase
VNLLIATTNPGKVREFREMLDDRAIAFSDLSDHPTGAPVKETGSTFRANAAIKASAYAKRFNLWTLADDSGLEVEALGGKPGVFSARWAEINQSGQGDADNNATLLQQLEAVPDGQRAARFVCVLALADPSGRIVLTARDEVEGRILREVRGSNGFGYDPLFYYDVIGCTTAELSPRQKHEISHRGKALRRLRKMMGAVTGAN